MIVLFADWPAPPPLPEFLAETIVIGGAVGAVVGAVIGLLFVCGGTPADLRWLQHWTCAMVGGVCSSLLNTLLGLLCGFGHMVIGFLVGGATGALAARASSWLVAAILDALIAWFRRQP